MTTAPTGSAGGSVQKASAVDSDKLWRDRITQELQYQRAWVDEYGFMVDESKRATLKKGVSDAEALNSGDQRAKTLAELKSEMSYKGMRSTAHDSYRTRPSPELFNNQEYNRKKFRTL